MGTRRTYPHRTPPPETLSARLAPLSRALVFSRSILPRISLSPPQPPKRPSRLRGKVARRDGLCNSARSFDSQPWTNGVAFPAVRPSHDTREETVARLRRGYLAGRLRTETFARRVDEALPTASRDELHGLTADLPAPGPAPFSRLRARLRRRAVGLPDA